jgi:2-haloacid dehalogenase
VVSEKKMVKVVIFDAYGTLLDVNAAMRAHAARLGPDWERISAEWRQKHTEYSWVRSLAGPGQYRDFWRLAQESLAFVAARHGISDADLLRDVLSAFRQLEAYPDTADVLRRLAELGIGRAILSNGEPGMLTEAVEAAGIGELLDDVLSVDAAGVYKPDPRVYALATARFGLAAGEMGFVSSNAWDAFGARAFGFRVFWVNRSGQPDEYGLRGAATELTGLAGLEGALT